MNSCSKAGKTHSDDCNNKQLAVANISKIYNYHLPKGFDSDDDDDKNSANISIIDHAWSRRILELISNKVRLLESFSWLSTVGGGFSSLGEQDKDFSVRAGALSLGQQLRLAELLGDDRLKVMCHLFGALAFVQQDNKQFCINYIKRVIIPLIEAMPYRDPIITNILGHICFRMSNLDHFKTAQQNAIENTKVDASESTQDNETPTR